MRVTKVLVFGQGCKCVDPTLSLGPLCSCAYHLRHSAGGGAEVGRSGGRVAMVQLQTGKKDSIFSNCTHDEEHRTADWVETGTPLRNKSTREFCCLRKIFLYPRTVGLFSPNETLCKTLALIERNMNAEP